MARLRPVRNFAGLYLNFSWISVPGTGKTWILPADSARVSTRNPHLPADRPSPGQYSRPRVNAARSQPTSALERSRDRRRSRPWTSSWRPLVRTMLTCPARFTRSLSGTGATSRCPQERIRRIQVCAPYPGSRVCPLYCGLLWGSKFTTSRRAGGPVRAVASGLTPRALREWKR